MRLWLYALGMCQSMFCAIPFPWHGWEEKARERMLLCLPVIGLEIGLIWWGVGLLCGNLPQAIRAFAVAAVPYLLTGFMHLDGFMDVTDAVRSYRSLERRREILKDSHVGSFAVIGVALVLLAQFSAALSLNSSANLAVLALIPVVSRCCSVFSILVLPPMSTSQYANRSDKLAAVPPVMLVLTLVLAGCMEIKMVPVLLVGIAGYALALLRAFQSLQGMNGDISGYAITLSELAALLALAMLY